jgi:hypothetical protein
MSWLEEGLGVNNCLDAQVCRGCSVRQRVPREPSLFRISPKEVAGLAFSARIEQPYSK